MAPSKDLDRRRRGRERQADRAAHNDDGSDHDRPYQDRKHRPSHSKPNTLYNVNIYQGTKKDVTETSSSSLSTSPVIESRQRVRHHETKSHTRYRSSSPDLPSESEPESPHDHSEKKDRRTPPQQHATGSKRYTALSKKTRKDQTYERNYSPNEEQDEVSDIEEYRDQELDDDVSTDLEESDGDPRYMATRKHQEGSGRNGDYEDQDFGILNVEVAGIGNKKVQVDAVLDTGTEGNWLSDEFREKLGLRRQGLDDKERSRRWTGFGGKEFGAYGKIELDIMCDEFEGFPHRRETFFVTKYAGFDMLVGQKVIIREGIYRRERRKPQGDSAYAGIHSKQRQDEKKRIEQRKKEMDLEAEETRKKKKDAIKKAEANSKAQSQRPGHAFYARLTPEANDQPRSRGERDTEKSVKSSSSLRSKASVEEKPAKISGSKTKVEEIPFKASRSKKQVDESSKSSHRSRTNEVRTVPSRPKAAESSKLRDHKTIQDTWSSDESVNEACF